MRYIYFAINLIKDCKCIVFCRCIVITIYLAIYNSSGEPFTAAMNGPGPFLAALNGPLGQTIGGPVLALTYHLSNELPAVVEVTV